MAITEQEWQKIREAVGILMGWRGKKDKTETAVRQSDLAAMNKQLKSAVGDITLTAEKLAAGATAAQIVTEVNKVIDDMTAISTALKKLGAG